MAPEVIQGDPYFTVADYFSLGIIVYEMALVIPPYYSRQKTKKELLTTILTKKVYYPLEFNRHLRDLIEKLLHLDQEKRKDLVKDLRGHPFFKKINWAKLEKRPSPPEILFGSVSI
ncbi:rhodopsin kinase GRK1-like [Rana temporaria]|uniref:rhodopsin kinase GRK1-like n=1 Tax=Rana temporaria TaxID=8407 RepID=UPI001AAD5CD3|nr:rhodopsin kinase GRK1-like [Rana temporaria]